MPQPISNLPVGAIVKSVNTKYNNSVIRFIVGHKTTNRVKLITEKIITLKCFDAIEASNPNSDRAIRGNNRYSQSNIDQWLNSAAGAGAWYSARHTYDAPPNNENVWLYRNEYDAEAGFLSNFEESFRNAILDSTIRVAKNTVTDGGGYVDIVRKVYLLSNTEVGLANENGVAEGTKWDLFSNDNSRQAYPTAEAVSRSEYTDLKLNASLPWYWWLRTPYVSNANSVRYVLSDGTLNSDIACDGSRGVRPALELASSILVSDSPDENGAYIIQWGTPQPISNLPVGALVKDITTKYYGSPIVWVIADKNHAGYPANSVTLISKHILTLKCSDAMEPSNSNSDRQSYGNNRYLYSNIRQWLNSAAGAGAWYTAQHIADAPPTNANVWSNYNEYDAQAGFQNDFSANFRNALLSTSLTVVKASVDGGGTETVADKVFLLSATEVGLADEGYAEGSKLALFSDDTSRQAYPTALCVSNSEFTDASLNTGSPWFWWLRTPYASYARNVRCVDFDGILYTSAACDGHFGVRPACNLPSSILVSDSPDEDGAYIIQWGTPNLKVYANGIKAYKNGWTKVSGQLKHIAAMWIKINGQVKKI